MAHDKSRIAIITNGNYFSNLALSHLLAKTLDKYEYYIVVTTGLRKGGGNRFIEALRLCKKWGWRYSTYKIATYLLPLLVQLFTRSPMFVRSTCQAMGVASRVHRSVNSPEVVKELQSFSPDLLISFSCPYKIKSIVLDMPTIGCLNVHSSLLPAYSGVCTYIHVLAEGETRTGVTIHEMVERFDAGQILNQADINIPQNISVFELFSEQCRLAGDLLHNAVEKCMRRRAIEGEAQDLARRSYRGEPVAADIERLRRNGYSLISWLDLKRLLCSRQTDARS